MSAPFIARDGAAGRAESFFFEVAGLGRGAGFDGLRTAFCFAFGLDGRELLAGFLAAGRAPRRACFLE
jgi:hypothetical protein